MQINVICGLYFLNLPIVNGITMTHLKVIPAGGGNIELLLKLKSSIENARIIAASEERQLQ